MIIITLRWDNNTKHHTHSGIVQANFISWFSAHVLLGVSVIVVVRIVQSFFSCKIIVHSSQIIQPQLIEVNYCLLILINEVILIGHGNGPRLIELEKIISAQQAPQFYQISRGVINSEDKPCESRTPSLSLLVELKLTVDGSYTRRLSGAMPYSSLTMDGNHGRKREIFDEVPLGEAQVFR